MAKPQTKELLNDLLVLSERFYELSVNVVNRVELFEAYLQQMPGKVKCSVTSGTGDDFLELSYIRDANNRADKAWMLAFKTAAGEKPESVRQAPVIYRARLLSMMPQLLDVMLELQKKATADMAKAVVEFDAWFGALKPPVNGNK